VALAALDSIAAGEVRSVPQAPTRADIPAPAA
jgi:hypothetical protein